MGRWIKAVLEIQFVRFGLVGGTVMAFSMLLVGVMVRGIGLPPQGAFLLAYPPALALHFFLNKAWTFRDKRPTNARHLGNYVLSVVVTFLIQWPVFTALQSGLRLPGEIATGGANISQMFVSFLFLRLRVFRGSAAEAIARE
jgi:putative flippase GtrA